MPARQTILKPLGLITRPNEYGAYPAGALAVADNMLFRDAGEMVVSKTVSGSTTIGAVSDVVRKLFVLDGGVVWSAVRDAGLTWTLRMGTTVCPVPVSSTVLLSDTGFIYPMRMRDHFFVNSAYCMLVSDVMQPATPADATFRRVGLPQISIGATNAVTAAAGAVAAGTTVGYAVLIKRVFAKGYEVVSTPSPVWRFINTAGVAVNVTLSVAWPVTANVILEGDIVEVYRTDAVAAALATTDPGTTCKLVMSYTLTAADIAAFGVNLTDTQAPGPLGVTYGRELYTNPGQQGALAANRQPNISRLAASYKGFAFYANVTERPIWTFQVPAGVSGNTDTLTTDYERTHGIGERDITATSTIGSPTVTGVSAAHLQGLKVGQLLVSSSGGAFPGSTFTIQSINTGLGTVTFTGNALASVAGATLRIADRIEVDGINRPADSLASLVGAAFRRYEVTVDQTIALPNGANTFPASGFTVSFEPVTPDQQPSIQVRATNGANYQPPMPEITGAVKTYAQTRRPNMLQWSHPQQPEHVPPSNSAFVGSGEIVGLQSTRDALWIFCTDGLFRLSGEAGQWRIDQLDTTMLLSAPQCCTALREAVYAYTNRGLVRIADDGFDELSEQSVGDVLVGAAYVETAALIVERDESNDEVHVIDTGVSGGAPIHYVFATRFECWSKLTFADVTALAYQRIPTNPATQPNGWLVIGRSPSGAAPTYALFDQNTGSANLVPVVQFQPIYADDPVTLKQWIDVTWIFQLADGTNGRVILSSWRGVSDGSATVTPWLNGDARATVGVPRSVAVAPAISPGFSIAIGVAAPPVCKGLSLRFQPLTEQQAYR